MRLTIFATRRQMSNTKFNGNDRFDQERFSVEQERLVLPLTNSIHRGGHEHRIAGCQYKVRHIALLIDSGSPDELALKNGSFRLRGVSRPDHPGPFFFPGRTGKAKL